MKFDMLRRPMKMSKQPAVQRPSNLEDVAFSPVTDLAALLATRQVRSVELTEMYLERLKRYNTRLQFLITLTDDLAMKQAKKADAEIAAGRHARTLHGIPWGAKDLISKKGYKTTWGAVAFKDQSFDYDATIVERLQNAGAVLIAKPPQANWRAAMCGSAARRKIRGIRKKDPAVRRLVPLPPPPRVVLDSPSAPKQAVPLFRRRRAAECTECGPAMAESAATA